MYLKTDNGLKWSKSHTWCTEFPEKKCQPTSVIETGALDSCGDPNFSDTLSIPVDVTGLVGREKCCNFGVWWGTDGWKHLQN